MTTTRTATRHSRRTQPTAPTLLQVMAHASGLGIDRRLLLRAYEHGGRLLAGLTTSRDRNEAAARFIDREAKRMRPQTYAALRSQDIIGDAQCAYQEPAFALGLAVAMLTLTDRTRS